MEKGTAVHKLVRLLVVAAILGVSGCGSSDPILMGHQKIQPAVDHNRAGRAEAFEFTALRSGQVVHAAVYISKGSHASRLVVGIYGTALRRQRGSVRVPGRLLTSG